MPRTLSDYIAEARARTREVTAKELEERLENAEAPLVIDVREPYEYERGHIPGALLVPRGTLEGAADPRNKHRVDVLCEGRGREIVVCCDTGSRSAMAVATLMDMGFESVAGLAGGLNMWQAEDGPVSTDPPPNELP